MLKDLKESRIDEVLKAYYRNGGIINGGSAGAIILGKDIMTSAHMDPNSIGLEESHPLNLLKDHTIWCHFKSTRSLVRL
ncbi:peptidase E [Pullulanibacillus pueri]|uniref:Cyanophycinase n=1 Tax=Pullulanibacillus pueri TaxID=1437324 RepID=A0A8J2ZRU7_9BACL|nr:Type 1 glutamine amidotransferase-like domain-containing protein [Pullulanibacillus pueri]MBM7680169.1 peptidase E [Pullulanibacillus pueri]GGH74685.1 hypothetical protein GCM10007096_03180 [Pullulanibacillus pueri]